MDGLSLGASSTVIIKARAERAKCGEGRCERRGNDGKGNNLAAWGLALVCQAAGGALIRLASRTAAGATAAATGRARRGCRHARFAKERSAGAKDEGQLGP